MSRRHDIVEAAMASLMVVFAVSLGVFVVASLIREVMQ